MLLRDWLNGIRSRLRLASLRGIVRRRRHRSPRFSACAEVCEQRLMLAAQPVVRTPAPVVFEGQPGPADASVVYVSQGADIGVSLSHDGADFEFGQSETASGGPVGVPGQATQTAPARVSMTWQGG